MKKHPTRKGKDADSKDNARIEKYADILYRHIMDNYEREKTLVYPFADLSELLTGDEIALTDADFVRLADGINDRLPSLLIRQNVVVYRGAFWLMGVSFFNTHKPDWLRQEKKEPPPPSKEYMRGKQGRKRFDEIRKVFERPSEIYPKMKGGASDDHPFRKRYKKAK
jgi:hypothetical protein